MEILSSPEEESKDRTDIEPGVPSGSTGEGLDKATGSTDSRAGTENGSTKESATEKRQASEEKRRRDARISGKARDMLAKFGISDRSGR